MYWGFDAFVGRWLSKAEHYNCNDLSQLFDKFFTLYVVYNALYDEAFDRLISAKRVKAIDRAEERRAIAHVATFLDSDQLAPQLRLHKKELSQVEKIVQGKIFYFSVTKPPRKPNFKRDQQLCSQLRSQDSTEFCESVLTFIYRTRCNMFHGK
jgi:hypothetical protein